MLESAPNSKIHAMQCFGSMPRVSVCRNNMAAKRNRQESFCVPNQYGSQKKPGIRHLQQSISSDLSTQSAKPSQTSEAFTH